MNVIEAIAHLVVPLACAGCGFPDLVLCDDCQRDWFSTAERVEEHAGRLDRMDGSPVLPVWAMALYAGSVRNVVVAWKDRGRLDLMDFLQGRIGRAVVEFRGKVLQTSMPGQVVVVPVPSSPAAIRSRGINVVEELARTVARELDLEAAQLLRVGNAKADQVGLNVRARASNVQGRILPSRLLKSRRFRSKSMVAILVDDVITTGATAAACENLLKSVGIPVIAIFCLAATPHPGRSGGACE